MEAGSFVEGLRVVHAALDRLVELSPDTDLAGDPDPRWGPGELREALTELARAEARLASLKLTLVAAAEASEVAAATPSLSAGSTTDGSTTPVTPSPGHPTVPCTSPTSGPAADDAKPSPPKGVRAFGRAVGRACLPIIDNRHRRSDP